MSTFNGFGSMYYGHSNSLPDGSYIATEWIVAFWIPIFPIASFRLTKARTNVMVFPPGSKTTYQYIPVPLNKKQVIRTYGFTAIVAAVIMCIILIPKTRVKGPQMNNDKSAGSLFEAICRIADFSYEPAIQKHPFIKEYLEKEKDPRSEWILLVTAAGTGYVLLTKEDYPGEHDEIRRSMESINGLPEIVQNFIEFMTRMYEQDKVLYRIGMGAWIMHQMVGDNFSLVEKDEMLKQIDEINVTTGKLISLAIENYVKRKA